MVALWCMQSESFWYGTSSQASCRAPYIPPQNTTKLAKTVMSLKPPRKLTEDPGILRTLPAVGNDAQGDGLAAG